MMMASDPFSVLGLAADFDVDAREVERAYLRRAAGAHPDVMGGDDEAAEALAGQLNEARAVLLDAERRAQALLALRGGPAKEEDKSLPAGFLMEMMQTREEIEEALGSKDAARVRAWREWALAQRAEYVERVSRLFREGGSHNLVEVRKQLNAWRYVERLIEQMDAGAGGGAA